MKNLLLSLAVSILLIPCGAYAQHHSGSRPTGHGYARPEQHRGHYRDFRGEYHHGNYWHGSQREHDLWWYDFQLRFYFNFGYYPPVYYYYYYYYEY